MYKITNLIVTNLVKSKNHLQRSYHLYSARNAALRPGLVSSVSVYPYKFISTKKSYCLNTNCIHFVSKRYFQTVKSLNEDKAQSDGEEEFNSEEQIANYFEEHQIFVKGVTADKINPIFNFNSLDVPERLKKIIEHLKYVDTTPIQAQSLPILMSGQDLIGTQMFPSITFTKFCFNFRYCSDWIW